MLNKNEANPVKPERSRVFLILVSFLFLAFSPAISAETGKILYVKDIPEGGVDKLWGTNVPANFLIYVVNPDRLAGWHGDLYDYEKPYIPEKYHNLPKLGGWHGGGGLPDKEMLLAHKVKNGVMFENAHMQIENASELQELGMNIYILKGGDLDEGANTLRDLGKLLGVAERGEELAKYAEEALASVRAAVKNIPQSAKPKVYIAQGIDGLRTTCKNQVLEIAGGRNAVNCEKDIYARQLSFEQLMQINPDVLVIQNPFFVKTFNDDVRWKRLRAYKNGKVYIVPFGPFSWMDKPEPVKYMAIKWLSCKLYPDRCKIDLQSETKKFMKLFMHQDLDDREIKKILQEN
ncbi:MAG: ABC transporter substrate-binding protein [Deferribacteraceae bacterium]|jgi:iron complex transport system substrate-binding protein|nr:ABC transporter substrate-binding protein [Deferribacteraceae bacterium]